MAHPATINKQFVDGINNAVAKVVAARRVLPARTVDAKILPAHEDYLQNIIHWRLDQLSAARAFGAYGAGLPNNRSQQPPKLTGVPGAIQTAYNAQAATITTAYNAQVNALKAQLNSITKDAAAKEKAAAKIKDKATITQLKSAVTQAKQAYKDGVKAADVQRQAKMTALANNFQNMLNQSAQSNNTLPPPAAGGGGGTVIGGVVQYPLYDANGNFIGYSTQPPPSGSVGGNPGVTIYNQPPVTGDSGGQVYDNGSAYNPGPGGPAPIDPAQAGAPTTSILDDLFSFINVFLGGGHPAPPANGQPAPVASVPQPAGSPPIYSNTGQIVGYTDPSAGLPDGSQQLDVFDRDPWGGTVSMGEFVPLFGNRTIRRLNNMSVVPKSAIGFSQWGTIISGVVQAAGQIGAAAASSALAPKQNKQAAAPVILQQPAAPAANNTNLYLIGGGALVLVGLMVFMKNRR